MQHEFTKQLIQLLANSGGRVRLSLAELGLLGVEIEISLASEPEITLRLGPKIYHVPARDAEDKERIWKENPTSPIAPKINGLLSEEVIAINTLNNRIKPQELDAPQMSRQHRTSTPLSQSPVGITHKTALDLFLLEQERTPIAEEGSRTDSPSLPYRTLQQPPTTRPKASPRK